MLIANDYLGLHPKYEIDTARSNLSIMQGPFGKCLQGSHLKLQELTAKATNLIEGKMSTSLIGRALEILIYTFILGEDMGTVVASKCGDCRCSKCSITGHSYSFKDEQELEIDTR